MRWHKRTGAAHTLTLENWRKITHERLQSLSWEQVRKDVQPFLEAEEDLALLTRENVSRLLLPEQG